MRIRSTLLFLLLAFLPATAFADSYELAVASNAAARAAPRSPLERRHFLEEQFDAVALYWLGTTWGLGAPQTVVPGQGKINCGTFVGTVLRDLGFNVSVKKLQRQPAELIIKSLAQKGAIQRYRNRPMQEFIAGLRKSGDGVYVIGLDFHVGFIRVRGSEVRFIHASYETGLVVDEAAATAGPIKSSRYRVVGKIFADPLTARWASGRVIVVRGNW